jgi:hypothetical protein
VEPERIWTVVPLLGFGVVDENGWRSAGAEAGLDIEHGDSDWRGVAHVSVIGLGLGCSEACFDGGPALTIGFLRSIGALWLGAGAGAIKQPGGWHSLPYGHIALDAAPIRLDLRIELPRRHESRLYIPALIGIPLPRRTR